MINLVLNPENFNFLNKTYNIIVIDETNVNQHLNHIKQTIGYFNEEITWDGMFNVDMVHDRLSNQKEFYIGLRENDAIGHTWFESYLDGKKIFNVFVRSTKGRDYCGSEFISYIIQNHYMGRKIYAEVDEWNVKSLNMFKKLGFQVLS